MHLYLLPQRGLITGVALMYVTIMYALFGKKLISSGGHGFWCQRRPEITNCLPSVSQAGNVGDNRPNSSPSDGFFNIMPASFLCPEVMSHDMSFASIFEFLD